MGTRDIEGDLAETRDRRRRQSLEPPQAMSSGTKVCFRGRRLIGPLFARSPAGPSFRFTRSRDGGYPLISPPAGFRRCPDRGRSTLSTSRLYGGTEGIVRSPSRLASPLHRESSMRRSASSRPFDAPRSLRRQYRIGFHRAPHLYFTRKKDKLQEES